MADNRCASCGGEIRMMTRKGTGYCSEQCFDAGEAKRVKEYDSEVKEALKWEYGRWVRVDASKAQVRKLKTCPGCGHRAHDAECPITSLLGPCPCERAYADDSEVERP